VRASHAELWRDMICLSLAVGFEEIGRVSGLPIKGK